MYPIGNESASDAYSEFLELQVEALEDSGDLDYLDRQFFEKSSFYFHADYGYESALAYDEALANITYGRHSEEVKQEIAAQYGITSNDVLDYEFSTELEVSYVEDEDEDEDVFPYVREELDELDELESWELQNESYLFARKWYGYENY
jgi:hypothetical protein